MPLLDAANLLNQNAWQVHALVTNYVFPVAQQGVRGISGIDGLSGDKGDIVRRRFFKQRMESREIKLQILNRFSSCFM